MTMEAGGRLNLSDSQKQHEAEKKERKNYGRLWIWEGYFNEKIKNKWLETADQLKHINEHVLQDIEDSILLKGFGRMKQDSKLRDIIDEDNKRRIQVKKTLNEDEE